MPDKFCANCGAPLKVGDRFCGNCGQAVNEAPASAPPSRPAPGAKPSKRPQLTTHNENGVPVIPWRNLDPNATLLFFFAFIGKTFILIPLFAVTAFVEPVVAIIMSASYLIILLLIARLLFKNFRFEITENAFHKEHGVFHKRNVSVPFEQIQNVNVRRSVLDQVLGLAHVEIETAGDSGSNNKGTIGGLYSPAEGYIPGVTLTDASEIRDLLLARMEQVD